MSKWILQPVDFNRNGRVIPQFATNPVPYFQFNREVLTNYICKITRFDHKVQDLLREEHIPEGIEGWGVSAAQLEDVQSQKLLWIGIYRRVSGELVGCASIREVEFFHRTEGMEIGKKTAWQVDNLTISRNHRGRGLSWAIIQAMVEIGVRDGLSAFVFGRDDVLGPLAFPAVAKVRVQCGNFGFELRDVTWIDDVRRSVHRKVLRDLKQGVNDGSLKWGSLITSEGMRKWRLFAGMNMIFIVGHSVYSYDENVEGLWVHYCIREADLDVDIGGRGAPVPGRPDMQVPRHFGNRGFWVDGVPLCAMEEASSMLFQEQNWSSGVVANDEEVFTPFS